METQKISAMIAGMLLATFIISAPPAMKTANAGSISGYIGNSNPSTIAASVELAEPNSSSGLVIEYEMFWIKAGLYTYYRMYGKWPASWKEVVDSDLFVTDLVTMHGNIIDPDDTEMHFYGDVYYCPPVEGVSKARLVYMHDSDGTEFQHFLLDPPMTYIAQYQWALQNSQLCQSDPKAQDYVNNLIEDPLRIKQLAIATMLSKGIDLFNIINGRPPLTWDEYVSSGFAPIEPDSTNPLTGEVFKGDGSANDFLYRYYSPEELGSDAPTIKFTHINSDGSLPYIGISY